MKNYIIPYGERFVEMQGSYFGKTTLMCVDNLGLVVKHAFKTIPTEDDVRRHLVGWNEQRTILIRAESLQAALKEFYNYPECKTGTKHKAWEMVDSERNPIIEYSGCEHMRLLKDGATACACYDEPTKGGHEICVLDGRSEAPRDCPIEAQRRNKGWRKEIVQIGGVWLQRYSKCVREMEPLINGIIPR